MNADAELVSVVLVNFRGVDDTISAVEHLEALDWPRELLEIVVVENGSADDSASRLRALGDRIKLVVSQENLGFAGGCNLGVRHAAGAIIGFLNNDARPDAQWVAAAMRAFRASSRNGAVASQVLDWDGTRVDFVDAGLTWYGMGYKPFTGEKLPKDADVPRQVLFGTGSGMFVRRTVYEALGGFDERYFMFFEDVDLGWRINLAGHAVWYEPASRVFHKHHASMSGFGEYKERFLLERNALFTLFKNAGDARLAHTLGPALALAVHRGVSRGQLDSMEFDLRRGDADSEATRDVPKEVLAPIYAIEEFVQRLPELRLDRERIQGARLASEAAIARLFGETDVPASLESRYLAGYTNIVEAFTVPQRVTPRKVVIITGDPLGAKMAGPAIRAIAIARELSKEHDVTLVSMTNVAPDAPVPCRALAIAPRDDKRMRALLRDTDIVIFQGLAMSLFASVAKFPGLIVADVYDPMHFELLDHAQHLGSHEWARTVEDATEVLNIQLARADFIVCASERQRMMYLGQLAAIGRVHPEQYLLDQDLRKLIDVAPFGLDAVPPQQSHHPIKGTIPGISPTDKVIIWSGGLYDWFDPHTLIRAVAQLAERRPSIKLFFQGTVHPNPDVPEMPIVASARALASELDVLDSNVFFHDSWVPYSDRENYLLDADVAVSTHGQHIETTFSFRTRILDYLWAGLPMVVTAGDSFGDLVHERGLGVVVPADDVQALVEALERMAFDEPAAARARAAVAAVRDDFVWERALEPLLRFVEDPYRAPDRTQRRGRSTRANPRVTPRTGIRRDLASARRVVAAQGFGALWTKVKSRLKRSRSRAT
jgi:GT2 family glycosyltransferase/glycosyltransferase involved in cell wall biosynthesis